MKIQLAVVSLWAEDVPANANFLPGGSRAETYTAACRRAPAFDMGGCYLTIVRGRPAFIHPQIPGACL